MDTEFINRLKHLRNNLLRCNQKQLGDLAGVTKQTVSNWERGIVKPNREALLKLERTANVNTDWLLLGCGEYFLKTTACVKEERADYIVGKSDTVNTEEQWVAPLHGLTKNQRIEVLEKIETYRSQNRAALVELRSAMS